MIGGFEAYLIKFSLAILIWTRIRFHMRIANVTRIALYDGVG